MHPARDAAAAYSRVAVLSAHLTAPVAHEISAISSTVNDILVSGFLCSQWRSLSYLSVAGLLGSCLCSHRNRLYLICPSRQACK